MQGESRLGPLGVTTASPEPELRARLEDQRTRECAPGPYLQAVTAARSTATHSASRGRGDAARRATEPARYAWQFRTPAAAMLIRL